MKLTKIRVLSIFIVTVFLCASSVAATIDFRGDPTDGFFDDEIIMNSSFEYWDSSTQPKYWVKYSGSWQRNYEERSGSRSVLVSYSGTSYYQLYHEMNHPSYEQGTWDYTQLDQIKGKTVEFGFYFKNYASSPSDYARAKIGYLYYGYRGRPYWVYRYGDWTPCSTDSQKPWAYASLKLAIPSSAVKVRLYINVCDYNSNYASGEPHYGQGNGKVNLVVDDAVMSIVDTVTTESAYQIVWPYGTSTAYGKTTLSVSIDSSEWTVTSPHTVKIAISAGGAAKGNYHVSRVILTVAKKTPSLQLSTDGDVSIDQIGEYNDNDIRGTNYGNHDPYDVIGITTEETISHVVSTLLFDAATLISAVAVAPGAAAAAIGIGTGVAISLIMNYLAETAGAGCDDDAPSGDYDVVTTWNHQYNSFVGVVEGTNYLTWYPDKSHDQSVLGISVLVYYGYRVGLTVVETAYGYANTYIYLD